MKLNRIITSLLMAVVCAEAAAAQSVNLAWDGSASPGVTNYILYATSGTNTARVEVGTNLTCSLSNLTAGNYTVYATAMTAGRLESLPSSNITFTVAAPPTNARLVVLQYVGTLASTNWQNLGFFKISTP